MIRKWFVLYKIYNVLLLLYLLLIPSKVAKRNIQGQDRII
jgi:hypothetical protein